MNTMRQFPLDEITLDYTMYGRGEVNTTRVAALTEIYTERPETFEPIRLWVDGGVIKLCDGFARYLAAQAAGLSQVTGFIDETIQTPHDAKRASVQHNTRERDGIHKSRLDAYILECWRDGMSRKEIQSDVNRSQGYISTVLKPFEDLKDWMRDLDILRLHLAGHTDEAIAESLGDITHQRVTQLRANNFNRENICAILSESRPDYVAIRDDRLGRHLLDPWEPPPLNFSFDVLSGLDIVEQELADVDPQIDVSTYWAFSSKTPPQYGTEGYAGRIPGHIVECLLHLYTHPFDHVYDPFAGGGTTLDVCKAYFRRYWGSDIAPLATRRDIRHHDILRGAPRFFPQGYRMHFIMLDPPYWAQKKGEYSADVTNLANLPLTEFYEALDTILTTCKRLLAPDGVMALIIGPTQNGQRYDHAIDIAKRLDRLGLTLINRLIVPYSTQQTRGYHITQMREANRTAETNAKKRLCKRYRDVLVMQSQDGQVPC
jgi:hypothetical protein